MPESKYYKKIDTFFKNAKTDIQKKLDITKEYNYNFIEENGNHVVEIRHDNKLKLKAEYNIIGIYNIALSFWYWGWSLPFINKKLLDETKKIQLLSKKLDKEKNFNKFNPEELEELYFTTSNNSFYCSSENIDRIIRLSMYITNALWYFPVKHTEENTTQMEVVQYIIITKVLQFN
jgi:hypothetical protein